MHLDQVFIQVAELTHRDRAAGWVSFGLNVSGRRYCAPKIVGARKLEALIFLHGIQIAAWLRCERMSCRLC